MPCCPQPWSSLGAVTTQRGRVALAEAAATAPSLLCTQAAHVALGMGPGSLQSKQQQQISSRSPPGLSSSTEILSAATINIHEVPQGAGPSFPLPSRWQGDSSAATDTSPTSSGSLEGQQRSHQAMMCYKRDVTAHSHPASVTFPNPLTLSAP